MQTTLIKIGDRFALVLDGTILDALKFDESTPLELETNGGALTAPPVDRPDAKSRLRAALDAVNLRHSETLRELSE